jgi:hypothetical protein
MEEIDKWGQFWYHMAKSGRFRHMLIDSLFAVEDYKERDKLPRDNRYIIDFSLKSLPTTPESNNHQYSSASINLKIESPSLADKFAVFIQGTTIEDKSLVLPVRDIRLANAIHNSFNPEGHLDMVPTDIVKKILEPLPYNLRMGINPI